MQYRKMPKCDDELSVLGYGCMRFPTIRGKIDVETSVAQLRLAIDNGVNYLDTAYPYHFGQSESFLGEHVLKDGYREKVYIATKLPSYLVRKEEDLDKFINKQLEKLKVDYIDYYLLHTLNKKSWENLLDFGILEWMDKIKETGKVRYMGFSFHEEHSYFNRIVDAYDWDFCQVQYNLLDEYYQAGIEGIEYAASKGLGIIVMEPLRGGMLVDKIPDSVQKIYDTADVKRTPVDWALSFIYNNPNVHVILSGMNKNEHIKENIEIASTTHPNTLTEKELKILDDVKDEYQNLLEIGCTGCRYCLPCPAKIDIPDAFKATNNVKMFGKWQGRMFYLNQIAFGLEKPRYTSNCIECGKCEEHCPQNLEIRKDFKKVEKYVETPFVKVMVSIMRMFLTNKKRKEKGT